MIQINPNTASCNCTVAFIEVYDLNAAPFGTSGTVITVHDFVVGTDKNVLLVSKYDYGQCSDFLKVS